MINPKELRIGNWLKNHNGDYEQVYDIGHDVNEWDVYTLDPIPLSEEILLKAGFKKLKPSADYDYYGIGNFTILYGRTYDGDRAFFLNGYHNDCHIKYLHRLQNGYYFLTNEELPITL